VAIAVGLTGCGSSRPRTSIPTTYTVPTTRTFSKAQTGELIRCSNHSSSARARVPPLGKGVGVVADFDPSVELDLIRGADGSLRVSCRP
jgi:hypothetical protein